MTLAEEVEAAMAAEVREASEGAVEADTGAAMEAVGPAAGTTTAMTGRNRWSVTRPWSVAYLAHRTLVVRARG